MRYLVVALILASFVSSAHAERRRGPLDAPPGDRREKVKQKIRALRAYTLTETLSLDEKTAAKMFPVLAKWDDVTDKLIVQRIDVQRQLEAAEGKDGRAIDKLIDEAMANQRALLELEEKRLAELRKILTPAQTARLIVVLPRFERRIRNQLARAIENRGAGDRRFRGRRAGARGGYEAIEDEDDDLDEDAHPSPRTRLPERTAPMRDTPRAPEHVGCDPYTSIHGCPPAPRR